MTEASRGTVIFDLDGTLVDSAPDLADALDILLAERGLAPVGLDAARQMIGHGIAELVRKGLLARGQTLPPAELKAATERFLRHYTAHLSRRSLPYPGAAEAVDTLRQSGWRLVVCTNKREAAARALLRDLDLLHAFALVAGPDTFGVAKPDPMHLLRCLPDLPRDRHPVVVVGDSEVDIAAARAALLPVIAVRWGYARRPLHELAPDRIADDFDQVPALVEALSAPTGQI